MANSDHSHTTYNQKTVTNPDDCHIMYTRSKDIKKSLKERYLLLYKKRRELKNDT